jgi:hypothetical protein
MPLMRYLPGECGLVMALTRRESSPALSPDGRWLAYDSEADESGRFEVYIWPVAAADRKWQLSIEGGDRPRWSGDGQIGFRSGRRMMAVDVATAPSFGAGAPRVLFEGEFEPGGTATPNYDLARRQAPADDQAGTDVTAAIAAGRGRELVQRAARQARAVTGLPTSLSRAIRR